MIITASFFFADFGVNIAGDALAVGISGRVFALPEVVVQLIDTAGAGFALFALVGQETALGNSLFLLVRWRVVSVLPIWWSILVVCNC